MGSHIYTPVSSTLPAVFFRQFLCQDDIYVCITELSVKTEKENWTTKIANVTMKSHIKKLIDNYRLKSLSLFKKK